jgi:hypothetical protein
MIVLAENALKEEKKGYNDDQEGDGRDKD